MLCQEWIWEMCFNLTNICSLIFAIILVHRRWIDLPRQQIRYYQFLIHISGSKAQVVLMPLLKQIGQQILIIAILRSVCWVG